LAVSLSFLFLYPATVLGRPSTLVLGFPFVNYITQQAAMPVIGGRKDHVDISKVAGSVEIGKSMWNKGRTSVSAHFIIIIIVIFYFSGCLIGLKHLTG